MGEISRSFATGSSAETLLEPNSSHFFYRSPQHLAVQAHHSPPSAGENQLRHQKTAFPEVSPGKLYKADIRERTRFGGAYFLIGVYRIAGLVASVK